MILRFPLACAKSGSIFSSFCFAIDGACLTSCSPITLSDPRFPHRGSIWLPAYPSSSTKYDWSLFSKKPSELLSPAEFFSLPPTIGMRKWQRLAMHNSAIMGGRYSIARGCKLRCCPQQSGLVLKSCVQTRFRPPKTARSIGTACVIPSQRSRSESLEGPLRDFKTGTGFADAKLSGGQKPAPAARVARFVRMTDGARFARPGQDAIGTPLRSPRSMTAETLYRCDG